MNNELTEEPKVHLLRRVEELADSFVPRTPLERELAAALRSDSAGSEVTRDTVLTGSERRALKAMSLAEARLRRSELLKCRSAHLHMMHLILLCICAYA